MRKLLVGVSMNISIMKFRYDIDKNIIKSNDVDFIEQRELEWLRSHLKMNEFIQKELENNLRNHYKLKNTDILDLSGIEVSSNMDAVFKYFKCYKSSK